MRTTGGFQYPTSISSQALAVGTKSISADNYGNSLITTMPFTSTIDKVAFYVNATTVAGDLTVRVETVTASLPSGSLYHANATTTKSLLASDDAVWVEATFSTPFSITGGDMIAVNVERKTGSTFTGSLLRAVTNNEYLPLLGERSGAAWSLTANRVPCTILHSSTDGWIYIPGAAPYHNYVSTNYTSASSPDEVGAKITMPYTARLSAVSFYVGGTTSTDAVTYRLYDSTDTVLWSKSVTFGTDEPVINGWRTYAVPTRPTLKKNGVYRATMEVTIGTLTYNYCVFYAGAGAALGTGGSFGWTERTNAGSWTDTDGRYPYVYLTFDGVGTNVPAHGFAR